MRSRHFRWRLGGRWPSFGAKPGGGSTGSGALGPAGVALGPAGVLVAAGAAAVDVVGADVEGCCGPPSLLPFPCSASAARALSLSTSFLSLEGLGILEVLDLVDFGCLGISGVVCGGVPSLLSIGPCLIWAKSNKCIQVSTLVIALMKISPI